MRGTRILRYIGNREQPEKEVYDPVERWALRCEPISSQTFLGLTDEVLMKIATQIVNPMFSDFHKDEGSSLFTPNNPLNEPSPLYYWMTNPPTPVHFRGPRAQKPPLPQPKTSSPLNRPE